MQQPFFSAMLGVALVFFACGALDSRDRWTFSIGLFFAVCHLGYVAQTLAAM
jgi:hypothetical protein